MKLDRPRRAGDAVAEFRAGEHVVVAQDVGPERLSGLAHPDLDAGVVDKTVLAAGEAVLEEAGVFADLPAAFDLGL